MTKLHLGCGYNKKEGWLNVDKDPECCPDLVQDLTYPNWGIPDNSVEEVLAEHILEHIEGQQGYATFWTELYRVCDSGAKIMVEVPHWKHETFFHDPTHVRAVTPIGLAMMDQQRNENDRVNNGRESKLGFMWNVDFELQTVNYGLDNVTGQPMVCYYQLVAVKPCRYKGIV